MQRRATSFVRSRFTQLTARLALSATVLALAATPTLAQKKYDTGVTDTEIKVGNIMPYSADRPRPMASLATSRRRIFAR